MKEIKQALISALENWDRYEPFSSDERVIEQANAVIKAARPFATLSSAAVAERETETVVQFRKVGCSDWYDGYADHEDGRGPYEQRTLYTTPHTPELEALRKRVAELKAELSDWKNGHANSVRAHAAALSRAETAEARLAEAMKALNLIDALDPEEHVYGCSADALRGIVIQMGQTARRVREGGKVDG